MEIKKNSNSEQSGLNIAERNELAMGIALVVASKEEHIDCIEALLKHGANPDIRVHDIDGYETTALIECASNGNLACVTALLDEGNADPNLRIAKFDEQHSWHDKPNLTLRLPYKKVVTGCEDNI